MDSHTLFRDLRNDLIAAFLEFIGTIVFLVIGMGGIQAASMSSVTGGAVPVNPVPSVEHLVYIAASMGLGLLVSAWLFFRVTGGVFNPAVSTALLLVGAIGPIRFILYCLAQILGAIAASAILLGLLPGQLNVTPSLGPNVNTAQGVFIEMFLTSFLVLAVLMLAVEKDRSTAFAPIGIGMTLFACHLFGVVYTGAGMNAARVFGPAVVSGFNSDHWVYWLGPFLGSLLATSLYAFLKHIEYWKLNPGQDVDDFDQSPPDPVARVWAINWKGLWDSDGSYHITSELTHGPLILTQSNMGNGKRRTPSTLANSDSSEVVEKHAGRVEEV
ncbi:aquaporin-like protein [Dacryopinax primogenitus]|uniref:Aquaporin-like protein n=1 Tax=Dacryopinax primogenitus (strain DJM 731) TaxID=1858805 RepID=M5G6F0_DACPD|nr:aquaporin-like protein [Dacryopinax primogenitus]EJU04269.1 aquaporin-like protein [Dacryopinax primogenitus]